MNHDQDQRLTEIVVRLDRLRSVPTAVLADIVMRNGQCLWFITEGDPPEVTGTDNPDRELAEKLCAGCPVHDECLELELRLFGPETFGVWGGLSEADRRALYQIWLAHRQESESSDSSETERGGDAR